MVRPVTNPYGFDSGRILGKRMLSSGKFRAILRLDTAILSREFKCGQSDSEARLCLRSRTDPKGSRFGSVIIYIAIIQ